MDIKAKLELAEGILKTMEIHEASWVQSGSKYAKNWEVCANEACSDLDIAKLCYLALTSAYADWPEWAEDIVRRRKHEQSLVGADRRGLWNRLGD